MGCHRVVIHGTSISARRPFCRGPTPMQPPLRDCSFGMIGQSPCPAYASSTGTLLGPHARQGIVGMLKCRRCELLPGGCLPSGAARTPRKARQCTLRARRNRSLQKKDKRMSECGFTVLPAGMRLGRALISHTRTGPERHRQSAGRHHAQVNPLQLTIHPVELVWFEEHRLGVPTIEHDPVQV